jgi:hypothetical protein
VKRIRRRLTAAEQAEVDARVEADTWKSIGEVSARLLARLRQHHEMKTASAASRITGNASDRPLVKEAT